MDINKDLIVSETGLFVIVDTHFRPHSWHIFEKHIHTAIKIISDTLYNLYQKGIVTVELKRKGYKIAELTVFKKDDVYVALTADADPTKKIGWLEKELILELANRESKLLKKTLFNVLNRVFSHKRLINPAKYFLLESLRKQNCNLYSYSVVLQFETEVKVEVWQETDQRTLLKSLIDQNKYEEVGLRIDRELIQRIVKRQLLKFQDLSD